MDAAMKTPLGDFQICFFLPVFIFDTFSSITKITEDYGKGFQIIFKQKKEV